MTGWQTAGPLSPAAQLQMGLWGSDPDGWARFAEPHNQPLFAAVLDATGAGPGTRLLDLGCGTGLLLALAQARGATVTGLDVTPGLLKIARDRLPTAELWQADIASLPFGAAEFDVVTGVNTFQFAADPPAAIEGALAPFTDPSTGGISMRNAMRWVTARRPARGVGGPHQPPG
jgi:trans-aconitate methyltransferase